MARNRQNEEQNEEQVSSVPESAESPADVQAEVVNAEGAESAESAESAEGAEAAPATVEEPKADERYKMITDPETGEKVKRKDFILKCWREKRMSRGDIAKKLSEITGKKVPYQIVFQGTKGVAGGPVKTDAAPASEPQAESTGETPASDSYLDGVAER